ncbi:hypothetical protein [Microlunatus parietis]|uniref:Peptidase MA superfamily protein n=1 Tax=Microlunatus parietis TaxID=682979 RepID=A0A7Y9LG57_9ACTN|nr:hypothetical protein [Microlunatus parietis]NYE74806.1 hypothetical protein [Microlunatus parietis]
MTAVLVTWAFLVTGCSVPPSPPVTPPSQEVAEQTLRGIEVAVRDRRPDDFRARFAADDEALGRTADLWWANLTALDVTRFTLTAGPLDPAGAAEITIDWAVPGDSGIASHLARFSFRAGSDGAARVAAVAPAAAPAARPSWWADPLRLFRQGQATVVATGRVDQSRAGLWADQADRAADRVADALPASMRQGWTGVVVVELPADGAGYDRLLGGEPGSHSGYAAVAWAEGIADPRRERIAVRIVVNPDQPVHDPRALELLLTHEVTHLARYDAGSPAPLWLVEGFADHVAYAGSPELRAAAEQSLRDTIRSDGAPDRLPGDDTFRRGDLDRAYLLAWSACRLIARRYGDDVLNRFVVAAGAGQPVDRALRATAGIGLAEFRAEWVRDLTEPR